MRLCSCVQTPGQTLLAAGSVPHCCTPSLIRVQLSQCASSTDTNILTRQCHGRFLLLWLLSCTRPSAAVPLQTAPDAFNGARGRGGRFAGQPSLPCPALPCRAPPPAAPAAHASAAVGGGMHQAAAGGCQGRPAACILPMTVTTAGWVAAWRKRWIT